jgi:simple sugar transport system ATP-binding protein/ribose transport system ATP-binding protein
MADDDRIIAKLNGISKTFGNTRALNNVSLSISKGSIHAIVGENGAGKSTLGKVLSGLYSPDGGTITIGKNQLSHYSVQQAQSFGIVMIAQELSLVPELTVCENVFLGIEHSRLGFVTNDLRKRFDQLEQTVHFGIDPDVKVNKLQIAERQKVEIMRALSRDARILILDEPTSSLTEHETQQLHDIMKKLANTGTAIIYVSHFLDAVLEVSDEISVMRNGELVATGDRSEFDKNRMIETMLGTSFELQFPKRRNPYKTESKVDPIFQAIDVTSDEVKSMDITVNPGEIVGLVGLVGSGRTEMANLIFGKGKVSSGNMLFNGKDFTHHSISQAIDSGISMVPEDRRDEGLFLQRSIKENASFLHLKHFSKVGILSSTAEKHAVNTMIDKTEIRPNDPELPVVGLSGGNQQKTLIAKWIMGSPKLIILDEPNRGVDIGAKQSIYNLINDLADEGTGILLISSEHEEILHMADRAYFVIDRKIAGEFSPKTITLEQVLKTLFLAD